MTKSKKFRSQNLLNTAEIYDTITYNLKWQLEMKPSTFYKFLGISRQAYIISRKKGFSIELACWIPILYGALYYDKHKTLPSVEERWPFSKYFIRPDIFV